MFKALITEFPLSDVPKERTVTEEKIRKMLDDAGAGQQKREGAREKGDRQSLGQGAERRHHTWVTASSR